MANIFNDYFCNVGKTLAEKIPDCSSVNKVKSYLRKRVSSCLFLSPTTPTEIFHQINSLKNSKSCGLDEVSSYFLKVAANILAAPISYFFNTCFTQDIFPDCLKIAKVIPVFKLGSKTDTTNYRPISIFSPFSKIFEKLIHSRTTAFLEKHSLLLPTQFGFRRNHSTTHALLDVVTSCYDNINDTNYTALLFLDLKKAFDTVKHEILIHKLEHYGIRGVALDFFSSFLTNRFQYVSLHHSQSSKKLITYGVPQGSVLGPLLFTIHINDISSITSTPSRLFADDTCLILKDSKFENLNHNIETEITNVNKWLKANKLSLNLSKSNTMILDPKHNLNNKLKLL